MPPKATIDIKNKVKIFPHYELWLVLNRILWMLIFIAGSIVFAYWDNSDLTNLNIGWFLSTSIWSAVVGIGYSITDWLLRHRL